ncbi:MAG: Trm112 family protein [Candidatus Heimdallarchaeota archaeon]
MKLRLLDLLACPIDKHWPLELYIFEERKNEKIELPEKDEISKLVCSFYCAKHKVKLVKEVPGKKSTITKEAKNIDYETECHECLKIEVVAGMIKCPKCNSYYPIIDEIAMMLKEELRNQDIEREFTEKWSEKIKALLVK